MTEKSDRSKKKEKGGDRIKQTAKCPLSIKIAMFLFFAVVLTMGRPIAARYISRGSTGAQAATVAKWGWTVSANSDALFGASYKKEGASATVVNTSDKLAVCATGAAELVAPGASGEMTFSIQGIPEVASSITVQITSASDITLNQDGTLLYRPIKWTLKRGDTTLCSGVPLTELIKYLENNGTATVAPGETSDLCGNYTLSWEWLFNVSETSDTYDYVLGKAMQSWDGSSATVTYGDYTADLRLGLELSIEIEQVD